MDLHQQRERISLRASGFPSLLTAAIIAAVALVAKLCSTGNFRGAVVVGAVAIGATVLVWAPISAETLLIAWFATAPLASFYFRFPVERSIITYDRVVFGLVIGMLLLKWARAAKSNTTSKAFERPGRAALSISSFEVAWALLSVLVLLSAMSQSDNVAYATRIAVDTFWLPLVAFHFARNHFDLSDRGKLLILAAIGLSLFLFVTGAYEFATGIDLFAHKGVEIVREGERRVNGPFASDNSYAIICLILFLFLRAAPRVFRVRLDRGARLAYRCALAGAALGALLPMFRAVAVALVVCWMMLRLQERSTRRSTERTAFSRRVRLNAVVLILIVLVGVAAAIGPRTFGRRLANLRTAYGRLATWKAAAEIVVDNPILGVGLGNYPEYYDRVRHEEDEPIEEVLETRASRHPHSNIVWIAAELGVIGLALYVTANVLLFLIGWRALRRAANQQRRTAAACYLALVIGYWIPGLTLASGYYSDLNLCYFFLLGLLSTTFVSSNQSANSQPPIDVGD